MKYEGRLRGHDATVRITDQNGEPWFIAKDVCDVLGLTTANFPRDLDADEQGVFQLMTPGGMQSSKIINESGLYSPILRSRKEEAKRFKNWVTSEVLPTIRKEGRYSLPSAGPVYALPQTLAEALEFAAKQARKKVALESQKQIMAPKTEVYDALVADHYRRNQRRQCQRHIVVD